MGRPTDLTDAVALAICESLEEGATLADAAALAGINKATVYGWNTKGRAGIEPYAAFVEAAARAKAQFRKGLIDQVNIYAGADQPQSWRAALELYKERCGSSRGAERERAREEITEEILDRIRTRLDPPTFARVVAALCDEGGDEVRGQGARGLH